MYRNPIGTLIRISRSIMISTYQPPVHRGLTKLDRSLFVTKVPLCVVKFPDPRNISLFSKQFNQCILRVPRIPHVIKLQDNRTDSDEQKPLAYDNKVITKGVLLTDSIQCPDQVNEKLPEEAVQFLKDTEAEILPYNYTLDYNYWKAEDILRSVLPEEFLDETPTGFTMTGHVAHLNLRKEFKPYDALIGQVILDKNKKIECVVDKVSSIATKFRTFPMKVIAGRTDSLVVEQKESDCIFKFDFSKVYWNSRLHTEHDRLVSQYFKPGEVVCDVFAGVGPFAVPAGKKDVIVLANDLNPESFKYLEENIKRNKVELFVKPFNLDGAVFIKKCPQLLQDLIESHEGGNIILPIKVSNRHRKKQKKQDEQSNLPETPTTSPQPTAPKVIQIPNEISHFVMNLPDSAIDFLGSFVGLYFESPNVNRKMPWIHVHCFEKYENDEDPSMEELYARVHSRILNSMGTTQDVLPFETLSFQLVRKVSPTKPMFCVSFKLPKKLST
ncbi:tRNA (guanine) methyltransferase KNAG_0B01970 [Huiozyma naganishii CBS 8797]|uniref:tRNA (guanine(37)-N1)-methyltransferase n=1 Tax=Huiozyma naganishii (strain ATCC MYA-139 / BCRC 22969 / CBS 8797 / KCTC 17520 / NBRC 10181 / NCYC 3082 / Yp74L-3) TaxID=1071383 RepID=J7S3C2_HUIN7|nr:hypothetical protein KNAG_0B01970 [Kazachstania naganishii CBS 8797]CCK68639.1 hypothetical protein KNAG_0B01970 [Kazachstania naganishii CBS 8797]